MSTTRTTCPYCGVGCGIVATQHADGSVTVKGDPDHPANFGRLCSKGAALGETVGLAGRLLYPVVNGARTDWDAALDLVAEKFSDAIREHGPDSVAFYVSGQLLTEDYYVANKLMKGYIGSANIDTNSRLCMASTVAGHRRAFGADAVPGCYEDLELADLVVLVGANLAWCHPVLFQRLLAAREKRGTRIVVVDPRRTVTAEAADLHLAIAPDTDVALFAGLLDYLCANGMADRAVSSNPGESVRIGERQALDIAAVAAHTAVAASDIAAFFASFGNTEKVVTVWSQGVNQSASGTDKVNAVINCHLATGRIGKPGMGPFSVTGQPNAMGGREVGGLANMLAAHMAIEDAEARDRVQRFWASPAIASRPGLKAVDLFDAVSACKIKALWIMGTNPAVSMPDAGAVVSALAACPFVVVSDVVEDTDTTRHAHVLLPAAAWGEKDGTVTNSERRISRQRSFLPLPGEVRPDWAIIADVGRRMGFAGLDYAGPSAVFAEHAELSGFENNSLRAFDISAVAGLDRHDYDRLSPFQWPFRSGQTADSRRLFGDGVYFTPGRQPRLPVTVPPVQTPPEPGQLRLNTGRIRDQWHTMTRTGLVPRLMAQFGEPFCDIHPQDADLHGISDADLIEVRTTAGRAVARARLTDRQRRGDIFMPMHWSGRFASEGGANRLTEGVVDPFSGQPALKSGFCTLSRLEAAWSGFAAGRRAFPADLVQSLDYYALCTLDAGHSLEFASATGLDAEALAQRLAQVDAGAEWISIRGSDGSAGFACFAGEALEFMLFFAPGAVEVSRSLVASQLGRSFTRAERLAVLAGRAGAEVEDQGVIVCACRRVGRRRIEAAIAAGCASLEAVGNQCQAGTECGACRPEITGLIDAAGRASQPALLTISP